MADDRDESIEARLVGARERPSELASQRLLGATLAALTGRESARLRAGRYVLLRELGRGGQGTVWEAEDPRIHRLVALKFVQERFEGTKTSWLRREAQTLARLHHENIVEVFDIGEHEGRPYVVMERLHGECLGTFASQPRREQDLVTTLVAAGRGLAAAHEAGVIHGDFKPSNVMVCNDGAVKVLDFGLARREPHREHCTEDGDPLGGTPGFMAPEQLRGEPADTRSDQYSFCASFQALLHEMSTGDVKRIALPRSSIAAIERGLNADPNERWPSMSALLAELTPGRSRRLMGAGGVVFAAGLLALALSTWGGAEASACAQARVHRLEVWNPGRQEDLSTAFANATRATAVPDFGVHTWARTSTAIDDYTADWEQEFGRRCDASDRGARACLLEQQRTLDAMLDIWASGEPLAVEMATAAVARLPDPSSCADAPPSSSHELEDDRDVHVALATIAALQAAGRDAEAVERAEALLPRADSASPSTLASALLVSGNLIRYSNPRTAAERLERALLLASAEGQDRLHAEAATSLAFVHGALLSDPEAAQRSLKSAEAALARLTATRRLEASLDFARAELALVHGKPKDAVQTLEATWRRLDNRATPPGLKSTVLHNLARARIELGDPESVQLAIRELKRVLELDAKTSGPSHPTNAVTYVSLGQAYVRAGEWGLVKDTNTRALGLANTSVAPNDRVRAALLNNLALASMQSGDFPAGLAYFERAYSIFEQTLGREHPDTAMLAGNLGEAAEQAGDLQAKIRWRTEALALFKNAFDDEHPKVVAARFLLARSWLEHGDQLSATSELELARAAYQRAASTGGAEVDDVVRERLAALPQQQ